MVITARAYRMVIIENISIADQVCTIATVASGGQTTIS